MRQRRLFTVISCLILLTGALAAQNCIPTNINGSVINFACNQPCSRLNFQIPHIKSSVDYTLVSIPYSPFPFVTTGGNEPTETYIDDQFSHLYNLPFGVCFFGSVFNSFVVGSNGVITFDASQADCKNDFRLDYSPGSGQPIPYVGNGTCPQLNIRKYPRYSVMSPYHDINPNSTATSPDRKIEWRVEGTAPCRKLITSFYRIALFGDIRNLNTSQIVIHESTGLVDVFIEIKTLDGNGGAPWNSNFAILGLQKDDTKAISAPGKNCTVWSENNSGYRFIPSAGASRYVQSQLYTLSGTLLATADTATSTTGMLDLSFPIVCFPSGANNYVIRTTFSTCENPSNQIISFDTITVNRAGTLNAFATTTNTDCGPPTGTIKVTVPAGAGTPPYTFILDGGAPVVGPSPHTFTNVGYGMHNILITESGSSCISVLDEMVNRNNTLRVDTSTNATACTSVSTGSITLTPTNGFAPYTYQLDGYLPVPGGVPYTFNNVSGGNHNVVVADATGCQTNVMQVDVAIGPGVTGNTTSTIASCTAVANGTITAFAATGIAPFTWQLDGGAAQSGTNPHVFLNVNSGAHTIVITDNVGCIKAITENVGAGPGVNGFAASTPASCQSVSNGTITATATSGAPPFTWQIDGLPFQPGPNPYTFTNISGGPHFVTIKDNVGCSRSLNVVNVAAGTGPIASATSSATSCNGAVNGSITVTAFGGVPPYSYSLNGAPPVSGGSSYTFINLPAGSHTVFVRDVPGCVSNSVTLPVASGPPLTTTVNTTNVLCNGDATGAITVTPPFPGTPPFQYSLNGVTWQNSNQFTGLAANNYTVFFRSANGCTGSQSVIITEPALLDAALGTTAVRCNGENNGIINVTPSGGVSPYIFSIDGGLNWQSNNIFNVRAGDYIITIRDFNGCITSKNITVTEPALLTASSINTNASCDGGDDGQITVSANGGNAGYLYSIDGFTFQASNRFYVAPGQYSITVKDNLGCTNTFNTSVGLTVNLFLNSPGNATICEGTSAQLQLTTNATIYSWTPATGLNSTTVSNPVANPTVTSKYFIHVVLGRCSADDSMIVNVNKAPIPDAGPDGDICYGQSDTLQGSGGTQFLWSPAIYLNTVVGANPVATPSTTTYYSLSVIDALGCHSLVTDNVKVAVSKPLRVYTFPFDTIGYPGEKIQLQAASAGIIYSWSPATRLNKTDISNPVVTVGSVGDDISYQVVATTSEGCKGEGYVKIKVSKGPDIYVPTGFTPDNNGKNDKFSPIPVGIKSYNFFRVFNRWGQMIFSTTRQNEGWDGTFGGKEQPAGVYVWMIEGVSNDNRVINKKGTILLIR